jgi:predicted secreted Zn-dependent protease
MKLKLLLKTTVLTSLLFTGKVGLGQTNFPVFSDDFNRGVVVSPISNGGTPVMTWTTGSSSATPGVSTTNLTAGTDYAANIYSSAVAGITYFTGPLSTYSSPFTPTLSSNTGNITWTFNMRSNRTSALAGFGGTTYGAAVVLGMTDANPTLATTNGYAVILIKGTTNNSIKLVRFAGGFLTANLTTIIGPSADLAGMTNFASVKVVYVPSTNTWSLFVRDDGGTTPIDPTTGTLIQVGTNTVNNTYTSTLLTHCGFLFSHSTATPTSNKGIYDNFKVNIAVNDPAGTDFTSFSLPSQINTVIDAVNHTVKVYFPYGTNVTSLASTFTLSSSSATSAVGATPQVSGTTTNDFTNPVTYAITSENTSNTQNWTVSAHFKPMDAATIISSGFTANWTAVIGAASYDVKCFINGYLMKTTNVAAPAVTADITGLTMGTSYTYQIDAKNAGGTVIETSLMSNGFITTAVSVTSINIDLTDGTWGKVYPTPSTNPLTPQSGSYPTYWVNGYKLNTAFIYGTITTDQKGNVEQNVIKIDKSSYVELPTISAPFEQIEVHAFFGSGEKTFALQEQQPDLSWLQVGPAYNWSQLNKDRGTDSIYVIPISRAIPSKLRLLNLTTSGFNVSKIITRTANPTTTLPAPTVGVASAISTTGFTANWTQVANASGYRVTLLDATGFLDLSYTVSGQATESLPIVGLDTISVTSFKVSALGDGVTYLDSYLSTASAAFQLRLPSPIAGVATAITATGFKANWATVVGALSYDVLVYSGTSLVSTTNASGQATTSCIITGLTPGTAYTFTVKAVGDDGASTSSSLESVASALFTTKATTASVVISNKITTYNGLAQSIDAAVTDPAGLTVDITYNGSASLPIATGTYSVVALINDAVYGGVAYATLTIDKAVLTVKADNQTKVFGTANPTFTGSISGYVNSETSSVITGEATYTCSADQTTHVGDVNIVPVVSGMSATNYSFSAENGLLSITKADLTVSGLTAVSKVYDANPTATLEGTATVTPLSSGEDVSVGGTPVGTFADKNVGNAKAVTVTGVTISGTDAENYNLIQQTGLAADITQADLTISGLTVSDKVYDATTNATIAGDANSNKIGGDDITVSGTAVGEFADKNVGIEKIVTVTGIVVTGADVNNYNIIQQSDLKADITAADLNVTGLTASNKEYDGSITATLGGTAAVSKLGTDDVTIGGTAVGEFADKNVGTDIVITVTGVTISGNDAFNYNLVQQENLKANITARPITITVTTGQSKKFGEVDPTFAYTITSGSLVSGDALTGALTRVAGETVGPYAILIGTLTAGSNYAITFVGTNFYITPGTGVNPNDLNNAKIYSNTRDIFIDIPVLENNTQVFVYNILGNQVLSTKAVSQGLNRFECNLIPGTYIVKMIVGKKVVTQKVVIRK